MVLSTCLHKKAPAILDFVSLPNKVVTWELNHDFPKFNDLAQKFAKIVEIVQVLKCIAVFFSYIMNNAKAHHSRKISNPETPSLKSVKIIVYLAARVSHAAIWTNSSLNFISYWIIFCGCETQMTYWVSRFLKHPLHLQYIQHIHNEYTVLRFWQFKFVNIALLFLHFAFYHFHRYDISR